MKTTSITLFYRQERSDKIYKASLEEKGGGYCVNFAYGRRGSTLKTGTKTQVPIPYDKAKKIYDKLVLSKTVKGYVPDQDNTVVYVTDTEQRKTGIHCQLLNPIVEGEVKDLISNPDWWLQEKKDGKRLLIQKTETTIAINRKGLSVGAPESMLASANKVNKSFIIDGEAIGDNLHVFDILFFEGKDLKEKTYQERHKILCGIAFSTPIIMVKTAKNQEEKQLLFDTMKQNNAEGIVFKNARATYQPGRPNSRGNQLKLKFYKTASVIVTKINDKRSVGISVLKSVNEIFIGNVTISVNKEIPKKGAIIEVRYLYAYKGGSLYQPTFLTIRTDIDKKDCTISQLKYKLE